MSTGGERAFNEWCAASAIHGAAPRTLIIVAHPDDDVLGVGGHLRALAHDVDIVYVTDGAPAEPRYFTPLGFSLRHEYAAARREEARRALALAGVDGSRLHHLGIQDQRAAYELSRIIALLEELLLALAPAIVLSHPYEGGHCDHDATAFAVHAALARAFAHSRSRDAPALAEFASYHERAGELTFGAFLPHADCAEYEHELGSSELVLKRAMLACHATQMGVFAGWDVSRERFRLAPRYDFSLPPAAPFLYSRLGLSVSGDQLLLCFREQLDESARFAGEDGGG